MSVRTPVSFSLLLLVSISLFSISISPAAAKNKKKQQLPDVVLRAQRVAVVIPPDANESVTDPRANRTAQDEVERAISKWGRFSLVMDASVADLVISVRKGHAGGPMISNSPVDDRPVVFQTGGPPPAGVRIGGQQGRPGDLTNPGLGPGQEDRGPQLGSQIGRSEDMFEVYLGGVDYPLDAPPIWRFYAKDGLKGPQVNAVEQFRKAIEDSEKQQQQPQKP
jgi:hypothetical protein